MANVSEPSKQFYIEIRKLIRESDLNALTSLLNQSPLKPEEYIFPDEGETLLHVAAQYGNLEVVQYLMESENFDVNVLSRSRMTPLLFSVGSSFSRIEIVKYLIQRGATITAQAENEDGIFHYAVEGNNEEIIDFLVEEAKSKGLLETLLNAPASKFKTTPFHRAVGSLKLKSVQRLIHHRVDLNPQNSVKHTPVHWAVNRIIRASGEIRKHTRKLAKIENDITLAEEKISARGKLFEVSHEKRGIIEKCLDELRQEHKKVTEWMVQEKQNQQTAEEILELLIQSKADLTIPNQWHHTPSSIASAVRGLQDRVRLEQWNQELLKKDQLKREKFREQKNELRQELERNVVQPDRFKYQKLKLCEAFQKHQHELEPSIAKRISQLINDLRPEEELVDHKKVWKCVSQNKPITEDNSLFYGLKLVIDQILSLNGKEGEEPPKIHEDIVLRLARILTCYQDFRVRLCHTKSHLQIEDILNPVRVYLDGEFPGVMLTPARIVLIERAQDRDNSMGNNVVKLFQHVFFKYNDASGKIDPIDVGTDCLFQTLSDIVTNHVAVPTELLIFEGHKQKTPFHLVCLASKGIEGQGLNRLFEQKRSELIQNIRMRSFSEQIVVSLLWNPKDAKHDNFIVDQNGDLVSIDNDMGFFPSITKGSKTHFVNTKNILYFFPQMKEPLSEEFVTTFLTRTPEEIMILWAAELNKKNQYFETLKKSILEKILTQDSETLREKIKIPLLFRPNALREVYEKLKVIQDLLRTYYPQSIKSSISLKSTSSPSLFTTSSTSVGTSSSTSLTTSSPSVGTSSSTSLAPSSPIPLSTSSSPISLSTSSSTTLSTSSTTPPITPSTTPTTPITIPTTPVTTPVTTQSTKPSTTPPTTPPTTPSTTPSTTPPMTPTTSLDSDDQPRIEQNVRRLTHQELFNRLDPPLAKCYTNILSKKENDILRSLKALYKRPSKPLESFLTPQEIQDLDLSKVPRHSSLQTNQTNPLRRAIEEFVAAIDFGQVDHHTQQNLMFMLTGHFKFIESLSLLRLKAMNWRTLEQLFFKFSELKELRYEGACELCCEEIYFPLQTQENLRSLYFSNEMKMVDGNDWRRIVSQLQKLKVFVTHRSYSSSNRGDDGVYEEFELTQDPSELIKKVIQSRHDKTNASFHLRLIDFCQGFIPSQVREDVTRLRNSLLGMIGGQQPTE